MTLELLNKMMEKFEGREWLLNKEHLPIEMDEYIRRLEQGLGKTYCFYPIPLDLSFDVLDQYKDFHITTFPSLLNTNGMVAQIIYYYFHLSNNTIVCSTAISKNDEFGIRCDIYTDKPQNFISFLNDNMKYALPDEKPKSMSFGQ